MAGFADATGGRDGAGLVVAVALGRGSVLGAGWGFAETTSTSPGFRVGLAGAAGVALAGLVATALAGLVVTALAGSVGLGSSSAPIPGVEVTTPCGGGCSACFFTLDPHAPSASNAQAAALGPTIPIDGKLTTQ